MRKIVYVLILCLMCFCMLACKPTPENEVVVNKNKGTLEEAVEKGADASDRQLLDIPQHVSDTVIKNNVTLNIDASVDKIDSYIFPVWTAEKYKINQTDVDNIAKVLIPSQSKIYNTENALTKSEIQVRIVNLKAEIESIKNMKDDVFVNVYGENYTKDSAIQEIKSQMDNYKTMYAKSPDERTTAAADLTFKDTADGEGIDVYIKNNDAGQPISFLVLNDFVRYGNDETSIGEAIFRNGFVVRDSETIGITLKEAENKASSELQDMGIKDMTIVSSGLINFSEDEEYIINYQRVLDDKYVFSNIQASDELATDESMTESAVDYSKAIEQEELTVVINKQGIIDLFWINAKGNFNKKTENVQMLKFDRVLQIAKEDIFNKTYAKKGSSSTININSIVLRYMCIKQKDNESTLLVVPVWDFIGSNVYDVFGSSKTSSVCSYLTVNAIDGSIIDRDLGY